VTGMPDDQGIKAAFPFGNVFGGIGFATPNCSRQPINDHCFRRNGSHRRVAGLR